MQLLIKNGRVIDPANKIDEVLDILIENSKISKVAKNIKADSKNLIDAANKIVIPGLVDMHTHLREPGREDKETIKSGTKAAAKGGVTSVLAMPNTSPAMDSPDNIGLLKEIIKKTASVNVFIAGSITKDRQGQELTDIAGLKKAGAIAISDDGASVDSEALLSEALKSAQKENILVVCHSEDKSLSNNGVVNLGFTSTRMGLKGISGESEYKRVARDIDLAKKADSRIHITHISCLEAIEIIEQAKKKGFKVTCDVTPHHFTLDESAALGYDTNMKMNPPLRAKADVQALREALREGIIDAIASDHAPHTENEKDIEFERAEFGVIGLETELAVAITELVHTGLLTWPELVKRMSLSPAQILGIDKGRLSVGSLADIIVIDPNKEWAVKKEEIISKSKNSAFIGRKLKGVVEYTICNGEIVYKANP